MKHVENMLKDALKQLKNSFKRSEKQREMASEKLFSAISPNNKSGSRATGDGDLRRCHAVGSDTSIFRAVLQS